MIIARFIRASLIHLAIHRVIHVRISQISLAPHASAWYLSNLGLSPGHSHPHVIDDENPSIERIPRVLRIDDGELEVPKEL